MNPTPKIRVGAVNYLNTKPLIYGLQQLAPHAVFVLDLPSRLADGLAQGRLDVALIPSVEFFQDPNYKIVSDACIACRGPVFSVKLFSRTPVERMRTLGLDEGSRTSVALVRILLKERFGIEPQLVFAMWTARAGADLGGLEEALSQARDLGLAHLRQIAEVEAAPLGLSQPECVAFLLDNLYFHLGPRELRGLELFYRLSQALGLAPAGVELGCYDCENAG